MPYWIRRAVPYAFLAVVLVFGAGGAAFAAVGPGDSVRMLQKGIDTKDMALVGKYLDVDAVVSRAVDNLLADEDVLREAVKNPAIAMVIALGGNAGANDAVRAVLVAEAREYVTYGVVSGAFAGSPEKSASNYQSLFGKVFRGEGKDRKRFGPSTVKSQDKKSAVVSTTLFEGVRERAYPLELRMEKQDGVWRVVALESRPGFMRKKDGK